MPHISGIVVHLSTYPLTAITNLFSMTKTTRLISILLSLAVFTSFMSCKKGKDIEIFSENEQIRLFSLVSDPGAQGDYATTLSRADSILALTNIGDTLRGYIMIEKDVALMNSGRVDEALIYSDTLIDFGKKNGISDATIQGLQAKGVALRRKLRYDETIECYKEALTLADKENAIDQQQALTDYLAILYTDIGRPDDAADFSRRSIALAKEMDDTLCIISATSTLGAILVRQEKYPEAIRSLSPYVDMLQEIPPIARVKFLTPLISSYLNLDSLPQARAAIQIGEDAVKGFPPTLQQRSVLLKARAELSAKEGDYASQWKFLCEMDSTGTHGQIPAKVLYDKATCLERLGKDREAFGMMRNAYEALDTTRRSDMEKELSDLKVSYETFQKEEEIRRLSYQKWILMLAATAGLLLAAIIAAAAIASRRRMKRKEMQKRQMEYIHGLEHERERMARELHDDIAGCLVGLQWEIDNISKEDCAVRISEICQRVRTLSHEMLPPQFTRQQLTALLLDMTARFNSSNTDSRIVLTDEGSFDWDSLSPEQSHELYRIIQEAVSNATRHGVPGEIRITLDGDSQFFLCVENNIDPNSIPAEETPALRTLRARAAILNASLSAVIENDKFKLTIQQIQ